MCSSRYLLELHPILDVRLDNTKTAESFASLAIRDASEIRFCGRVFEGHLNDYDRVQKLESIY